MECGGLYIMGYNKSLDFLNMIRNGAEPSKAQEHSKPQTSFSPDTSGSSQISRTSASVNKTLPITSGTQCFAVIDTETNWHDQVMSLGVAVAEQNSFKCVETRYYIFEQEARVGGMYSNVMHSCDEKPIITTRQQSLSDLTAYLNSQGITDIYAYNAKFDYSHLPELNAFNWYDIMRIAAYRQFNKAIPASAPCCKTGRLKSNYGVEPITRMLTGSSRYFEVHNAVADAVDELRIIELLNLPLASYEIARINA